MKKRTPAPAHARLGPSSLKAVEICPSYTNKAGESAAAAIGTAAHKLMEKYGVRVEESPEFRYLACDQQMEALQVIAEYVRPFEEAADTCKIADRPKRHAELKLDLSSLGIEGCDFGTADLVLEYANGVDLFDYKFGWIEVEDAETNIQTLVYALGCFAAFPKATWVRVHILQPNCDMISTANFGREHIPAALLRAQTVASRKWAMAGKEFHPVTSNCLWCGSKATCKALHAFALKTLPALQLPADINLDWESFNDISQAGNVYDVAKLVERWAKDMRERITGLAIEGEDIPGKMLRTVSGKARIVDAFGVWEKCRDEFNLSLEEFLSTTDPSITKLESAIAAPEPRGNKGKKKDEVRQAMMAEGYIVSGPPSAFLVDVVEETDTN
jgi:uncharacterized protein DUF2800